MFCLINEHINLMKNDIKNGSVYNNNLKNKF